MALSLDLELLLNDDALFFVKVLLSSVEMDLELLLRGLGRSHGHRFAESALGKHPGIFSGWLRWSLRFFLIFDYDASIIKELFLPGLFG